VLIVLVADRMFLDYVANDYIDTHNKFRFKWHWGAEAPLQIAGMQAARKLL